MRRIHFSWAILLLLPLPLVGCVDIPFNTRPFNQQVWLKHTDSEASKNPRGPMTGDLIRNHLKKGMTRREVIALLGQPDGENRGDSRIPVGERKYFT